MTKGLIGKIFSLFKSDKIIGCPCVFNTLYFDWQNNIRICPKKDNGILIRDFDGIWLDVQKINQDSKAYINKFKSGRIDEICSGCEYLQFGDFKEANVLKEVVFAHWKNCYLNCKYCNSVKNNNLLDANHYDIFDAVNQLIDAKKLTTDTRITFECGDSLLHPEFNKLLYFFINFESKEIIVNTPALVYRESVADAIAKNAIKLVVNLDCANKQIYKNLKGEDSFEIAIENIKRYIRFQEPDEHRVVSKYTLYNGINDGKKEISDWYMLCRDLGINELLVDIDENWYLQFGGDVPEYFKEMLHFIKNISSLDAIDLRFSPKVNKIYLNLNKKNAGKIV